MKMKKFFSFAIAIYFCFTFSNAVGAQEAQEPDVQCIGNSLGNYISQVFQALGTTGRVGNVRLLSPAFNLTNAHFETFVTSLSSSLASNGYGFGSFDAIAGNAYNMPGGNIGDWVSRARGTDIGNRPIILTEMGWYPHDTNNGPTEERQNALAAQIDNFGGMGVRGGLIFNVFGYNPDPNFAGQVINPHDQVDTLICGGNCYGKGVGANSAGYYMNNIGFYNDAETNHMRYTLEIYGGWGSTHEGVTLAHEKGMTPIVRFGVQQDGGGMQDPQALANFIRRLDEQTDGPVYVIVGSNEPLTECWATPECQCGGTDSEITELPRTLVGFVTTSKTTNRTIPGHAKTVEVTNEAIQGATICVYQGTAYHNGLVSNNGAVGPRFRTFQESAITDEEGFFTLDTAWRFAGDHRSYHDIEAPPSNFVAFFCGNNYQGAVRVDVRRTATTLNLYVNDRFIRAYRRTMGEELNLAETLFPLDITINCPPDVTPGNFDGPLYLDTAETELNPDGPAQDEDGNLHPECPAEVEYTNRSEGALAGCEVGEDSAIGQAHHPNQVFPTFGLVEFDERYEGGDPSSVPELTLQEGTYEGRTDTFGFGWDYESLTSSITRLVAGGFLQGYFSPPMSHGGGSTPPDCELLRESNRAISTIDGSGMNSLKAWGFGPPLTAPSSHSSDVEETYNPSKAAARYLVADKNVIVCRSDEYGDVSLGQIQPPRPWVPLEEYCSPGGTTLNNEPCPYLLDSSYFRHDLIYLLGLNHTISAGNKPISDSYESPSRRERCYALPCPWDGTPDIANEEDPYADGLGGITEVQVMANTNDEGHYSKASAALLATDYVGGAKPPGKAIFAPNTMVGVPQGQEHANFDGETEMIDPTTGELLTYTLNGLNYATRDTSAIAYIGRQSNLCMYSILDGHHLWPLNRFMSRNKHHPTATFYDFRSESVVEDWGDHLGELLHDPDTLYGKPHSGLFANLFYTITSFFRINASNWRWTDDDDVTHTSSACVSSNSVECHGCREGCTDCAEGGCSLSCDDQEPPNCSCRRTVRRYTCTGEIPPVELQNRATPEFRTKNTYGLDGFVFGFYPPNELRYNVSAQCMLDGYATQAGIEEGEGYFTNCGKDHDWMTNFLRKMVSSPLGHAIEST